MTSKDNFSDRLQAAIDLAQSVECHGEANQLFQEILADLAPHSPQAKVLFEQLWREYIAAQRSSLFWQQISQVEKRLSDRMTESHLQLKQNYLRLVQEQ